MLGVVLGPEDSKRVVPRGWHILEQVLLGGGVENLQETPAALQGGVAVHRAVVEVDADRDALGRIRRQERVCRPLADGPVQLGVPPRILVEGVGLDEAPAQGHGLARREHVPRQVELDAILSLLRPCRCRGTERGEGAQRRPGQVEEDHLGSDTALVAEGEAHARIGAAGEQGDVRQLRIQEDTAAHDPDLTDEAFDGSDVARGIAGGVDDADEGRTVVELEGLHEVSAGIRARGLVASHRKLQHLQDDVARQVHVRRKAVGTDIEGELLTGATHVEGLRVGAAADALSGLEEADLVAHRGQTVGRVDARPPAANDSGFA
mmetsp:Transcript_2680/g.10429  ORF Transcript_2680/g.10429 Transcript_2680/m.10429 type:complete len:320 (+) Transcript_2680:840-1799(+)